MISLTRSETSDIKPVARVAQARPRDAQARKQHGAAAPASSKPAGGATGAAKHSRDASTGAKKNAKPSGKSGSATQVKPNSRSSNSSRVIGKFSWFDIFACLHGSVRTHSCMVSSDFFTIGFRHFLIFFFISSFVCLELLCLRCSL